jgi:hypothetical protein
MSGGTGQEGKKWKKRGKTHSCDEHCRLFRRSFRLEDEVTRPVIVNDLDSAGTLSSYSGLLSDDLTGFLHGEMSQLRERKEEERKMLTILTPAR